MTRVYVFLAMWCHSSLSFDIKESYVAQLSEKKQNLNAVVKSSVSILIAKLQLDNKQKFDIVGS